MFRTKLYWTSAFTLISISQLVSGRLVLWHSQCTTDTLDPCTQHPSFPDRSIVCENINDMKTFLNVIRCGHKKNLQEMFVEKSTLDYLPLFVLDYCGFLFLNVKSVVLSKLLEGNILVRLQQLHLDRVIIRGAWNWEPLSVLKRLVRFSISNMPVPVLNGSLVDNLSDNMLKFSLVSTGTTSINNTALEKFADLEYLSIQNNEISELKRSMFPNPANIKYFFFGKNKISSLPDDLFENMPHLKQIGLQGNLISQIHERTFRGVWKDLTHLFLNENPLKCLCKMLWLTKKNSLVEFSGTCYAPKHKYGKELKSLSISDFQCF